MNKKPNLKERILGSRFTRNLSYSNGRINYKNMVKG